MTYNLAASQIIKSTIRSAVCIDDMFEAPYMSSAEIEEINKRLSDRDKKEVRLNNHLPRSLYKAFRENGECDLDIYNYVSMEESWHPEYMLNNKDLVIVDWELEGDNGYQSSLKILEDAVSFNDYPNIPFAIIYTSKPKEDFKFIIEELISKFHPYPEGSERILNDFYQSFLSAFDNCFLNEPSADDVEIFFESIDSELYEYWKLPSESKDRAIENICNQLNNDFEVKPEKQPKSSTKLRKAINESFGKNIDGYEELFYLLTETNCSSKYSFKRISSSEISIKINDTILVLFSKDQGNGEGVKPEEVFDTFSHLICTNPNNFLTILSIEMKDKLRDNSYKIANSISSLDERAFFHHLNSYKKRSTNHINEFYDFLLKCWINEIELYNNNFPPNIFETIPKYIGDKGYEKLKGHELKDEIGELGVRLSTVKFKDRLNNKKNIAFGDIFKVLYIEDEHQKEEYLICITPTCVCLDPSKVHNNFYFVKSEVVSEFAQSSAPKKIEIDYYSLIKPNGSVLAINWGECKPYSFHVENNDINNLISRFCNKEIRMEYICSSKETFTQRIANKAFSYGTSIGIDIPNTNLA